MSPASEKKEKAESLYIRFHKQDTPTGVSSKTIELLAHTFGMTKTDVIHLALRQLADRALPKYELDEGPLTDAQHLVIRTTSPASKISKERFTKRLF